MDSTSTKAGVVSPSFSLASAAGPLQTPVSGSVSMTLRAPSVYPMRAATTERTCS